MGGEYWLLAVVDDEFVAGAAVVGAVIAGAVVADAVVIVVVEVPGAPARP